MALSKPSLVATLYENWRVEKTLRTCLTYISRAVWLDIGISSDLGRTPIMIREVTEQTWDISREAGGQN